jgi:hypothetical protein
MRKCMSHNPLAMVTLETTLSNVGLTCPGPSWAAFECFGEEGPSAEPTCTKRQVSVPSTLESRAGIVPRRQARLLKFLALQTKEVMTKLVLTVSRQLTLGEFAHLLRPMIS